MFFHEEIGIHTLTAHITAFVVEPSADVFGNTTALERHKVVLVVQGCTIATLQAGDGIPLAFHLHFLATNGAFVQDLVQVACATALDFVTVLLHFVPSKVVGEKRVIEFFLDGVFVKFSKLLRCKQLEQLHLYLAVAFFYVKLGAQQIATVHADTQNRHAKAFEQFCATQHRWLLRATSGRHSARVNGYATVLLLAQNACDTFDGGNIGNKVLFGDYLAQLEHKLQVRTVEFVFRCDKVHPASLQSHYGKGVVHARCVVGHNNDGGVFVLFEVNLAVELYLAGVAVQNACQRVENKSYKWALLAWFATFDFFVESKFHKIPLL